jgi:hypothetical protein
MRKTIFDASELEKQKILEQHNLIKKSLVSAKESKKTINEQTAPVGTDLLNMAIKLGCKIGKNSLAGSEIFSSPGKPDVLYKVADFDSVNGYYKKGDELYIKPDYTFDVVSTVNGVRTKTQSNIRWECSALKTEIEKNQQGEQQKVAAATDAEISYNKTQGGWKKRELIKDSEENLNNPAMYQTKVVNGVKLYRNLIDAGVVGAVEGSKGAALISSWRNKGWLTKDQFDDPDELQAVESQKRLVISKDSGLFPEDLYMYPNPEKQKDITIGTDISTSVGGRVPTDITQCKTDIKNYYIDFNNDRLTQGAITPSEVQTLKRRVQACKYEFCLGEEGVKKGKKCNGEWGGKAGLLGLGKNKEAEEINKYVDMMSGLIPGGPSSGGEGKIWRLY